MKAPTKGPRPAWGDAEATNDARASSRRGELEFPAEEAETLTAHGSRTLEASEKFLESDVSITSAGLAAQSQARVVAAAGEAGSVGSSSEHPTGPRPEGESPRRRDTMPVPPSGSGIPLPMIPRASATGVPQPPRPRQPTGPAFESPLSPSSLLDDDSEVEIALGGLGRRRREDDTQTKLEAFVPGPADDDQPTSPTLSLAQQSDAAREVYRLFLASRYAPALELANELISQGDDDPMLLTIARECRLSVQHGVVREEGPWDEPHRSPAEAVFPQAVSLRSLAIDERTTIGELATLTGVTLEELLAVLDRFVALGVLSQRPPS